MAPDKSQNRAELAREPEPRTSLARTAEAKAISPLAKQKPASGVAGFYQAQTSEPDGHGHIILQKLQRVNSVRDVPSPISQRHREALHYANRLGWYVFPCEEHGKRPITSHGFKDATTDPAQINQWWEQHPNANIGLDCGRSGLLVIDLDGPEGVKNWNALQDQFAEQIPRHQTAIAKTGSGEGAHIYYTAPAGVHIRNSAGKLAKGIDVRAQGGYTILPSSVTENPYEWTSPPDNGIAPLPDALLKLLTQPDAKLAPTNGNGAHDLNSLYQTHTEHGSHDAYVQAALERELAKLCAAMNGTRNDQLNKSAFALGQLVGIGALDRAHVESELYRAASEIGYVDDDGERQTRATIKSGLDDGEHQPRAIPPSFTPREYKSNGHASSHAQGELSAAPGEWLPLEDIMHAFDRAETGDAEILTLLFADRIAYDHSEKRWYFFEDHAWARDRRRQITHLVTNKVAAQFHHAAATLRTRAENDEAKEAKKEREQKIKELYKRAAALQYQGRIDRVLDLARRQDALALTGEEWHKDSMLLACKNGVLNLRADAFEFRTGQPCDYLRSTIPTEWQGLDAAAPRWEQFVDEIFAHDAELVAFVRRLFGYGLTGQATDDKFPVLWGEGRNGKDTLLETVEYVLGNELAAPVQSEVLVTTDRNPSVATPHLIALRNRRIVWVNETNEGARLNAGQVKMLTGGGTIAARPLYGESITFRPTHLIMLMTNHRPHTSDDDAIWKRLLLIPFSQRFIDNPRNENEHRCDPQLGMKLRAEAPGILAWLVRGALEWQSEGLKPPASVLSATDEYRAKEDTIAQFIAEKCVMLASANTKALELYAEYKKWAEANGQKAMTNTAFGERMGKRFAKGRDRNGWSYRGVGLIACDGL